MGIQERRQREKEQRREEIIEAATAVFTKKGLDDATMDEIAAKAELSKATLYLYFKNKEELFLAVLLIIMDVFCQIIESSQKEENSAVENIRALGKAYFEFYQQHPAYFKLTNTMEPTDELNFDKYEISKDLAEANARIWQLACSPIEQGIREGMFKPDTDSLEVALTLWTGSTGIINMMDHVAMSPYHKAKCKDFSDDLAIQKINNMNFRRMLDNLWEAVISYIKVEK
jgi:AcrR family transcriptional regulator